VCGGSELADRPKLRRLGLARVDVDRIFARSTVIAVDGSLKVYVRMSDVRAQLREYPPGSIRRSWEVA
jgi:hypothetical protein